MRALCGSRHIFKAWLMHDGFTGIHRKIKVDFPKWMCPGPRFSAASSGRVVQ